jgi:phosphatidylserine/phosphatidylglycerophosphate/cardiolipin synthase-like enzyme
LEDALANSKERLMIISPWIRHQVVTDRFVRSLEALLRSGVKVYIGYGLVEDGGRGGGKPPITPKAERDLKDLEKRFKNLTFSFIGNTHRKVLVSDNRYAVTTSFNWLSFRGDPKEKPRDEAGIYISKPDYIESTFRDCVDLIQRGYTH